MKGPCIVVLDTPTVDHTNSFNRCQFLSTIKPSNCTPTTHKPGKTQVST